MKIQILNHTSLITCILTVAVNDVLCITYAATKQFILQCTNQFWSERPAFVTRKCNWEKSNNFGKRITDLFLFIVLLRWVNCHRILNLLQIVFIISLTTSTAITNSDQQAYLCKLILIIRNGMLSNCPKMYLLISSSQYSGYFDIWDINLYCILYLMILYERKFISEGLKHLILYSSPYKTIHRLTSLALLSSANLVIMSIYGKWDFLS